MYSRMEDLHLSLNQSWIPNHLTNLEIQILSLLQRFFGEVFIVTEIQFRLPNKTQKLRVVLISFFIQRSCEKIVLYVMSNLVFVWQITITPIEILRK